jgi:hypothetical protein
MVGMTGLTVLGPVFELFIKLKARAEATMRKINNDIKKSILKKLEPFGVIVSTEAALVSNGEADWIGPGSPMF